METLIGLDEDEQRLFIELRRIAMKNGSVHLNYDKRGKIKSIDEYHHREIKTLVDNSTQFAY